MSKMTEKPILFNGKMVKAILEGRKTQTRRVIKFENLSNIKKGRLFYSTTFKSWAIEDKDPEPVSDIALVKCPYGDKGDELWVRETFFPVDATYPCLFKANMPMHWDDSEVGGPVTLEAKDYKWKPSIFMPRDFSRIQLTVKDIRVERVQDISDEDCEAEGIYFTGDSSRKYLFRQLWDSINLKRGFGLKPNPWVWVIEFERKE